MIQASNFSLGLITATGPAPENRADTPTKNTYWVKLAVPDASLQPGTSLTLTADTMPGRYATVQATNLAEPSDSHLLATNDSVKVQLFRQITNHYSPRGHYFFWRSTSGDERFEVITDSHTQDGSNKRWKYLGAEAEKTGIGYTAGWTLKDGGRAATGPTNGIYIYNKREAFNAATGTFGNAVSSINLTGTFDIKPIPDDTLITVEVKRVKVANVWYVEWWTDVENGIDGACS